MNNILVLLSALTFPAIACVPTSAKYVSSSANFTSHHCRNNSECPRDQGCYLFTDGSIHDGLCVWDH